MVLILTILFLCPYAWILAVITGWIIIIYLVVTALEMERNEKKNGKISRTIKRAGMLFYGKPNQHWRLLGGDSLFCLLAKHTYYF